jgi:hypothetical protein
MHQEECRAKMVNEFYLIKEIQVPRDVKEIITTT